MPSESEEIESCFMPPDEDARIGDENVYFDIGDDDGEEELAMQALYA